MRSEKEIREKIEECKSIYDELPWWEDEREYRRMVIDALSWVVGDEIFMEI